MLFIVNVPTSQVLLNLSSISEQHYWWDLLINRHIIRCIADTAEINMTFEIQFTAASPEEKETKIQI